jgi:hypothetical protein
MVNIVEATRLMWCPGLAQFQGNPKGNMQEWLGSATFAPSVTGGNITLIGIDKRYFLENLAADINRTASAASETLRNITKIDGLPKSMAWAYVKLYYASLFYAHTMLRIWGRSPSFLRTSDLLTLRRTLVAYGIQAPFKVQTGQFLITADMTAPAVQIAPDTGGGGSHEAIWREFHNALTDLQTAVSQAPFLTTDKVKLDGQLKAAILLLSKNGSNVSWPSQMRNNIQYRQEEGVWYPYKGRSKASSLHQEIVSILEGGVDFQVPLKASGDDLQRFRSACAAVIILAHGVLSDLSGAGGTMSFLRFGQSRFEDAIAKLR